MTLPNVPKDANMPEAVRSWLERLKREIETALGSIGDIVIPTKASEADAIAGTDDVKFLTSLSGVASVKEHSPFLQFAYFEDQKSANTPGGSATANTNYYTRDLNTEIYNGIAGCTLSSNEVALPIGAYLAEGRCPAHRVASHKCRLFNATTTGVIAYGSSEYTAVGSNDLVTTPSVVLSVFALASPASIRLEHAIGTKTSTQDYGKAANLTGSEVYSTLKIWKLD